jgi:hypothetical protein
MVRRRSRAVSNHEATHRILRDAKKLVIGPAKPDPLDAAPQDEDDAKNRPKRKHQ